MELYETNTLIIGAGTCGSYIGIKLRERGVRVSLVEMENDIGGLARLLEFYRIKLDGLKKEITPKDYINFLKTRIMDLGIPLYTSTAIIDLKQENRYFIAVGVSRKGVRKFRAEKVLVATGGRERNQYDLLITGTRPAGVFTGLLALDLIDRFHEKIGRKALVYTNNDLGLEVALRLMKAGLSIENIITTDKKSSFSSEFLDYLSENNIDVIENTIVTELEGFKRLEGVILKDINSGETWRSKVDTLVISMGFVPSIDLLSKIKVKIDYETKSPVLTRRFESSIPNLFVCGLAARQYRDLNKALMDSVRHIFRY